MFVKKRGSEGVVDKRGRGEKEKMGEEPGKEKRKGKGNRVKMYL